MFFNIMKYFKFSTRLSMFYDIIGQASIDLVLFILMIMIILLGNALMGHMLFGANDNKFDSIGESILTLFLISIGTFSVLDIQTSNQIVRGFYGVTYLLTNLMLLNMLVAIMISHYLEYYGEMGSNKSKVLSLFIKMISGSQEEANKLLESKW